MKILADPNIPLLDRFEHLGQITTLPGRSWTPSLVRKADILLIRSVTRIDEKLLKGSRVRFVGSATSGIDHVDVDYLKQQSIYFSYCPGSNATSVAEYILSALLAITPPEQPLQGMNAAIIGCGHVGSRVAKVLQAAGVKCLFNDPPLKEQTGDNRYRSLGEVLRADIVTLHTPLTFDGSWPTAGLICDQELQQMKPNVILINAARGGIIDENALLQRIEQQPQMKTVIDCWNDEPSINPDLLGKVTIGTPHIAGYSFDGKVKATRMLYDSLCNFLGVDQQWEEIGMETRYLVQDEEENEQDFLRRLVFSSYDIRIDDQKLKQLIDHPAVEREKLFDRLRKDYRIRYEFERTQIVSCRSPNPWKSLGFQI